MMVISTIVFVIVVLVKSGHCRNVYSPLESREPQEAAAAIASDLPVVPENPAMSELLFLTRSKPQASPPSQISRASRLRAIVIPPSTTYTMRPLDVPVPGMTSMTETPLLWCGEDEDNVELTLDDLEAGSGSDEIPPELRGIAREEWRKNHPDEQLSDDDTFDSYEMENTRIEVIG